jgi:hypothetical protein
VDAALIVVIADPYPDLGDPGYAVDVEHTDGVDVVWLNRRDSLAHLAATYRPSRPTLLIGDETDNGEVHHATVGPSCVVGVLTINDVGVNDRRNLEMFAAANAAKIDAVPALATLACRAVADAGGDLVFDTHVVAYARTALR